MGNSDYTLIIKSNANYLFPTVMVLHIGLMHGLVFISILFKNNSV